MPLLSELLYRLFWHNLSAKSYLLCSKQCQHNVEEPTHNALHSPSYFHNLCPCTPYIATTSPSNAMHSPSVVLSVSRGISQIVAIACNIWSEGRVFVNARQEMLPARAWCRQLANVRQVQGTTCIHPLPIWQATVKVGVGLLVALESKVQIGGRECVVV